MRLGVVYIMYTLSYTYTHICCTFYQVNLWCTRPGGHFLHSYASDSTDNLQTLNADVWASDINLGDYLNKHKCVTRIKVKSVKKEAAQDGTWNLLREWCEISLNCLNALNDNEMIHLSSSARDLIESVALSDQVVDRSVTHLLLWVESLLTLVLPETELAENLWLSQKYPAVQSSRRNDGSASEERFPKDSFINPVLEHVLRFHQFWTCWTNW